MMNAWLLPARVGLLLLAVGLLLVQATPTAAQERPSPEAQDGSSVFALPDWAEPRSSAANAPIPRSGPPEAFRTNDDDPPVPPAIPIGGLEWLIAAGAGYGLWKLRATGTSPSTDS
jgi:hypothetical protein